MKLNIIFLISAFLLLAACEKPNPHPETLDPIYAEFEKEADVAEKAVIAAEKELEGFKKDLEAVAPQSGQIKYAQKRVYETEAKIEKIKQMAQYWRLRVQTRKEWAMKSYLSAYKEKKPWPDPKEYEEYKQIRKLELAPRQWNLKARMDDAKAGMAIDPAKAPGGGGHDSPPPASSAGH